MAIKNNKDISNLSKDELLKLLLQSNAKIEELEFKNTKLENKNTKLKNQKSELESKNAELENKNFSLNYQLHAIEIAVISAVEVVTEQAKLLNKNVILLDDFKSKSLVEQVSIALENYAVWVKTAKSWFHLTPLEKGADVKGPKPTKTDKELKEELKKAVGSLKNNLASLTKYQTAYKDAIKQLKELNLLGKVGLTAAEIEQIIPTPKKTSIKKGSSGRKKVYHDFIPKTATSEQNICPKDKELEQPIGEIRQKILSHLEDSHKLLEATENIHNVSICPKCGHVTVNIDDNQDLPVIPNREISIDTSLKFMELTCHGIPLNRFAKYLYDIYSIGNDTLYYSLNDYVRFYIKPLYQMILMTAKDAEVIVCDETTFDCLESKGLNTIKKVSTKATASSVTTRQTNYLLAISSAPHAAVPFILFSYINSRSTEAIKQVITDDFKFKTLICDGYNGYSSIVDERPGTKLQRCLIHFRRAIIKAHNPTQYYKQLDVLNEQDLIAWIKDDISNNSPAFILRTVYIAISKIYEIEASVDYSKNNWQQELLAKRKESRKLMEHIDSLMETLSIGRIKQNKAKTKWEVIRKGDPYADPCVYYANQKNDLTTFLDDANISPDSNIVEGAIRPITILRRSTFWKRSEEYMQSMNMMFSVWNTLAKYWDTDTEIYNWLRAYSRALFNHCYAKRISQWVKDGNDINKQIKGWDFEKLSEDFDFKRWNPTKLTPKGN